MSRPGSFTDHLYRPVEMCDAAKTVVWQLAPAITDIGSRESDPL